MNTNSWANVPTNAKCEYCNKGLKKFVVWKDWSNRKLHYSCYKKKQEDIALLEVLKQYNVVP